jgi:hypothetical protein
MNKQGTAGVDVSQHTLDVAARAHDGSVRTAQFANTATGHHQLMSWLTKGGKAARVVLHRPPASTVSMSPWRCTAPNASR